MPESRRADPRFPARASIELDIDFPPGPIIVWSGRLEMFSDPGTAWFPDKDTPSKAGTDLSEDKPKEGAGPLEKPAEPVDGPPGPDRAAPEEKTLFRKILSVVYFLFVLYMFFFCIELMGESFKLFGKEEAKKLFEVTSNPFIGLVIGVLATSLMQSSSSTTSIVVTLVAAGTLTVEQAVPMIMGANIGTTITNTIVSVGHVRRKIEFERAFSGAVVHDFFNLCSVIIFLPLEIFFHPIQKTAEFVADHAINFEGAKFESPLKLIVEPAADGLIAIGKMITSSTTALAIVCLLIATGCLIFALSQMVSIMRGAVAEKLELIVDKYLFTGVFRGLLIGMLITAIVQSSSITTSLVVPLLGAGIVRLDAVFPYMVGANLGTTVTAFMASLVTGNKFGITIAICHFVFNLFGTFVFIPLRIVPVTLAKKMGKVTAEHRWFAFVYIAVVFFLIPAILIFLTS